MKSHIRSTRVTSACRSNSAARMPSPVRCHAHTVRPSASCRASPPCPGDSSRRRPPCQTGNTLGRCDVSRQESPQLGQSYQSTSELPHHECIFLLRCLSGPKGTGLDLRNTYCANKKPHTANTQRGLLKLLHKTAKKMYFQSLSFTCSDRSHTYSVLLRTTLAQ